MTTDATRRMMAHGGRLVVAAWLVMGCLAHGQTAAPAGAEVPAVVKAIDAAREATLKAFNSGDSAGLAAMFLEDGEVVDENGTVTETRAEIEALFRRFFEKFPKVTLEMEVTDARAVGDEVVIEEGIRRITADQAAAAAQVRYVAVRTKQGDAWPIASYREFADDPLPTAAEMLAPLDWLVGEWVDESPEGNTKISYQWSEDGNFLLGEYNLSVAGQAAAKSVQRIGWDPVEGELRSWTFDSDGGFSEGEWLATDDGWLMKSKAAEETAPPALTKDQELLVEIRDLLKQR